MAGRSLYQQMECERKSWGNVHGKVSVQEFGPMFIATLLDRTIVEDSQNVADFETSQTIYKNRWIFLPNVQCRIHINTICKFCLELCETLDVDLLAVQDSILKQFEVLPLELLWLLEEEYGILTFTLYFMNLTKKSQFAHIENQIISFLDCYELMASSDIQAVSAGMLRHILQQLILLAYSCPIVGTSSHELMNFADTILVQVTEKVVGTLKTDHLHREFIMEAIADVDVHESVKCRYSLHQLGQFAIQINGPTFEDIMQRQEGIVLEHDSNHEKVAFISLMFQDPLQSENIEFVVKKAINNPTVNWLNVLLLVTKWLTVYEYEAVSSLREIIKSTLTAGLSAGNTTEVESAFLLARQSCLVSPNVFGRYEVWYSRLFQSKIHSPANQTSRFIFMVGLFCNWIPQEPPRFLQAQSAIWPFIPPGCRNAWADYVSLAKVRVAEYNEVEGAMEFEPNPNNLVQDDVNKAINSYRDTKKIPLTVMNMFMFQKSYYFGEFLPALVKKPDVTPLTDARLCLIEALNKADRIPPNIYAAYRESLN